MYKPKLTYLAVSAALVMNSGLASAEIEVSGYVKNESAFVTQNDQFIGEARTKLDKKSHHNSLLKFENTGRMFVNGDIGQESTWHADLNLVYDSEGVESEYKGHQSYSQNDILRELYVDTRWGNTDIRIGKQQVVWGTADGIKLLDIINPTDFRELNQNTPDDARIPIWMINADTPVGDSGSFQVVWAQQKENKIPGLDKDGDNGHPFVFKGVDTITGAVNGFLNIAPALGKVSQTFSDLADNTAVGLHGYSDATVAGFVGNSGSGANFAPFCNGDGYLNAGSARCLNGYAQFASPNSAPNTVANGLGNNNVTNVMNSFGTRAQDVTYDATNPKSAFEYMPNATFATFNTFAGNINNSTAGTTPSMVSTYKRDYDQDGGNLGFRFRDTTASGINYSLNYFYHYDANPSVSVSFHDADSGERLVTELRRGNGTFTAGAPITRDEVTNNYNGTDNHVGVGLRNAAGAYYGACDPGAGGCATGASATHDTSGVEMRFTETATRIHSLGGSFDMAFDSFSVPVILRAEFLYDKDTRQPVIDRRLLGIGDLEGALQSEKQDFFKYVIGVDITAMTNLLVSTQFIQFRNLDFEDVKRTCTTETNIQFDCSKYTGDAPTLHLSNGLQKAEENKEFISVFLSKPFGADQQGRWNNITILEDTGGYWNRFDVEYGFTDELIGSVELNTYWGDDDSWFGQLKETSNVQVGVKYIFD